MRVIDNKGENHGLMQKDDAIALAKQSGLDLIEVSNNGEVCVCKVMDYGKYVYELSKKEKEIKSKAHTTETKNIQVSVGISEHDVELKAKNAAEWLKEGHRVKIELQLKGRNKYMDEKFLRERLDRILAIIPAEYKIAEPLKRMPKGMFVVLEKSK
jgi:translation initiation factor IF-3